ncbi:cyclase family protein [Yunchengibacter salinarum]|uniref:cyclase family protein n=1 Tax=Yunchengibacter salinarum TaxID=3133399 RepID=UPI0035B67E8B
MTTAQPIDLSHTVADGTRTHKGLPPLHVCDFLSREDSAGHYAPGTSFQIDRLELVGNTGTYIDSPFHRYHDGVDLAGLDLGQCVALPGLCLDLRGPAAPLVIDAAALEAAIAGQDIKGRAVLIRTDWCRHFDTPAYQENHPFLTAEAASLLQAGGAALVGIDSHNIDDIRGRERPAHTILLGDGIPIVEHMTGLKALPRTGFRFFAAPLKFHRVGTMPVRAFALPDPA